MQKDLKIGLAVGSGLVGIAVIWLATRPSLTPQARLAAAPPQQARKQNLPDADTVQESVDVQSDTTGSSNAGRPLRDLAEGSNERDSSPETPRENLVSSIPPQGQPALENPVSANENEPIKTEKFYIVRKNDTLSKIAYNYYGNANEWPKIFERNRHTISDANKLTIGAKLIIPD